MTTAEKRLALIRREIQLLDNDRRKSATGTITIIKRYINANDKRTDEYYEASFGKVN